MSSGEMTVTERLAGCESIKVTQSIYNMPSREQIADRMWSESCIELARIRDMLEPAFRRHQAALDALTDHGREAKYPGMGKLLTEAWREFQVQRQVEAERTKGR